MTNSINSTPRNQTDIQSGQSNKTSKAKVVTDTAEKVQTVSTSTADTVSITGEASRIRELQSSLANVPDIDLEKVESIKKEIASGNYPIDHERIAGNLLDLEKILS
ncbi:MAG: flagellar biosynthesis anti-sigma factor FlgM [Gammaproteobacteria bacterium]|nr:flagellar biosynthesis anti-sigma factor FlgM [Gammaproteobacteria bacterium]